MNVNLKTYLFLGIFIFSLLYCLLYILRDYYFTTENFKIKKYINSILPFFTIYNKFFLIASFIFLIFSFYKMYITQLLFFIIIIVIILSLVFIYIPVKNFISTKYLRFLSYILLVSVLLIPLL